MPLCYTDTADNSPEVECDTLTADVTDTTLYRDDVAATESTCDDIKVDDDVTCLDDVTCEMANHPATVDTCTPSPAAAAETPCVESTGQPSRLKKFIDRRTETLISACATVSTSAVDEADVTGDVTGDVTRDTDDAVDKSKSDEQVTSPVSRLTKFRDQKFDVGLPHDRRQLGVVVTPHRSMLRSVPATTTATITTTTSVNAARSPASLIVLRSERQQRAAGVAVTPSPTRATTVAVTHATTAVTHSPTTQVVSPSTNAESRLTVTLADSTWQQSQRSCRLITRTAAASTKPRDVTESGSENVIDDVSAQPAAVQSPVSLRRSRTRSVSSSGRSIVDGDVETTSNSVRPRSTVCVLALLSPVTVQPVTGPGRPTSSDRRVPAASAESSAAADAASTSVTTSRHDTLIRSPPPQPVVVRAAVAEPSSPSNARSAAVSTSSGHPAAVSSPSRRALGPTATERVSVMTALDHALAMLTSVVSENSQTQPASAAVSDVRQATQSTCKSPSGTLYFELKAHRRALRNLFESLFFSSLLNNKGAISSSWVTHLKTTGRHLPYGITLFKRKMLRMFLTS